jgi:hypothetical protein
MAKRSGMYKSGKRQKEMARKKKQEEKRLKRQKSAVVPSEESAVTDPMNIEPGSSVNMPEVTDEDQDKEEAG